MPRLTDEQIAILRAPSPKVILSSLPSAEYHQVIIYDGRHEPKWCIADPSDLKIPKWPSASTWMIPR